MKDPSSLQDIHYICNIVIHGMITDKALLFIPLIIKHLPGKPLIN